MPTNVYNQNFLETPDPVSGLQRRTGQNFIDHKQTLHERLTLEHDFDPGEGGTQPEHGTHKAGSARAYVTEEWDSTKPTNRPTGQDKDGAADIPATPLGTADGGRLLIQGGKQLFYWNAEATVPAWEPIDTTPVGMMNMWPGADGGPNNPNWYKCNGQDMDTTVFAELFSKFGYRYGGSGSNFKLPNMQGISVVGAGSQTDFDGSGRTKGSGATVSTLVEDAIQTFDGRIGMDTIYSSTNSQSNNVRTAEGIFEATTTFETTPAVRNLDRQGTKNYAVRGFALNLNKEMASGEFLRNEAETRVSAIAMDYYVKAL